MDVRGTQVAAIASDVYEYAFSQSVGGNGLRSVFAASSEGETDVDGDRLLLVVPGTGIVEHEYVPGPTPRC